MIRKEIKPDKTFGGNYVDSITYLTLPEKFIEITEEQKDYIDTNSEKLRYDGSQDGIWQDPRGVVDISNSQEYLDKQSQKEKEIQIVDLKSQIDEIDKKRIRAIAEPQLKDGASGQTWLEYYTEQITALRAQIAGL